MKRNFKLSITVILLAATLIFFVGCDESPLWEALYEHFLGEDSGFLYEAQEGADKNNNTNTPTDSNSTESTDESQSPIPDYGEYPTTLSDPEEIRAAFYGDSDPADSYEEAIERSKNYQISGALTVPDQAPTYAEYRPMLDGKYVRNNEPYYIDNNTYVVVDLVGREVFRVYRGGGYITLEEVAAYLYAFGEMPANYISSKNTSVGSNKWGEYLRVNHSEFSGDTDRYPYEPELPDISGCGGSTTYYEIDIGTTGTDCDPSYTPAIYNNGTKITRGAARIVYTVYDANGDKIIDPNEKYLFYTYNHYNDFQEYLNYFGGWGEIFGNITGGGTISSKSDYNPTPYVPVAMGSLKVVYAYALEADTPMEFMVILLPTELYGGKKLV